jgi:hypothetical protein
MILRDRRGFGFLLIFIVLLAAVVVFAFMVTESSRVQASPAVQQAFWRVNSHNSTTANIGEEVEAHVIVRAKEDYSGSMVLKIRKDVSFWSDSDYATKTFPIDLKSGQMTELELTFTPDEAGAGRLRGYFMEVDFLVTHTNWGMANSYPPRLTVVEQSQTSNQNA